MSHVDQTMVSIMGNAHRLHVDWHMKKEAVWRFRHNFRWDHIL
jgi:hypothetical protein